MAVSGNARRKLLDSTAAPRGLGHEEPIPKELRELLAIRSELSDRIERKRRSIAAAFAAAGVKIAASLAEASTSTIRAFLEASEGGEVSTELMRSLAKELGVSPLVIAASLNLELSETQRFYLSVQLHRLDALAQALVSGVPHIVSRTASPRPR